MSGIPMFAFPLREIVNIVRSLYSSGSNSKLLKAQMSRKSQAMNKTWGRLRLVTTHRICTRLF